MITRKVDLKDASPAGFTYSWIKKLGERLEKLYVITWQESNRGDLPSTTFGTKVVLGLPQNIEIISLSGNKVKKIFNLWIKLLKILPKVDGIFCHQNPEYTILSAPCAKLFRKKVITWYAHGTVNLKLHMVNFLADKILTSSDKGCRLKNRKKIEVVGQGIDIDYFKPVILNEPKASEESRGKFKIISVGRISPAKDYQTLIEAINVLVNEKRIKNLEIEIIGAPGLESQQEYFEILRKLVKDKNLENYIKFLGPVSHNQILPYYQNCDLFINLSQTGSMDKAVLEAMAYQRLVLTCNDAFIDFLNDQRLICQKKNPQDLAKKIINLINLPLKERENIGRQSRDKVVRNHNLDNLVNKIIDQYGKNQV